MSAYHAKCDSSSTATTSSASRPNSESMGRRMLFAVGHEHVAAAAHSLNEARCGRISFENAAQTPDLHVDAAVGAVVFRTVQQFEQALARKRAHGVIDENLQQREFAARQRERLVLLMQRARLEVQREAAEVERLAL